MDGGRSEDEKTRNMFQRRVAEVGARRLFLLLAGDNLIAVSQTRRAVIGQLAEVKGP